MFISDYGLNADLFICTRGQRRPALVWAFRSAPDRVRVVGTLCETRGSDVVIRHTGRRAAKCTVRHLTTGAS